VTEESEFHISYL